MIAVIPVAGEGTRLKPHTYTLPKVLINVAGKPIIAHILDELKNLRIKEVIIIIGHMGEMIKEYINKNYDFKVRYIEQKERKGLGHAIYLSRNFIKNKPVLIVLGDTIFKADLKNVIDGKYSSIGVKEVDNPKRFGTVKIKGKFIEQLVEKSERPPSNLAIVGIYYIKNTKLLSVCLEQLIEKNIKTAGEYQLTDALQLMIKNKEKMTAFKVGNWYDCGKVETLLQTNKILLETNKSHHKIAGSIIINPVFIDKSVQIKNSIIGPYVSIAKNCFISNSMIRDSIINEYARVENILLDESIIGSHANIVGKFNRINLGDSSEVNLGFEEG